MSRAAQGLVGVLILLLVGCDATSPELPACAPERGYPVRLAVGQYVSISPLVTFGCALFPPSGADTAEYLVIPQSAAGIPGASSNFRLAGATVVGPVAATRGIGASVQQPSPAERFHTFLRRSEETRWSSYPPAPGAWGAGGEGTARQVLAGPPSGGSQRGFSVCTTLDCSRFQDITATAVIVRPPLALYVDDAAPAGGLLPADLDTLANVFISRIYGVTTGAFGRESDIDNNSLVIVLMTPVVNALTPRADCDSSFVVAFFSGADIDPAFGTDRRFNRGEMLYSLVADPKGALSCPHSREQVKAVAPPVFAHELQHMISYNQHVLSRAAEPEVLWLNEALSHLAEEQAGPAFLPGDSTTFTRFTVGNLRNAYQYLAAPENNFALPAGGIGTHAERGAGWLYLRYLVDRFGPSLTARLVQTRLTGAANVAAQTGRSFDETITQWALANWVSDLPAFAPPAALQYRSWAFRATFAALHAQQPGRFGRPFPLMPTASAGSAVKLCGTLRAGSGAYHRVTQPPGDPGFGLSFATTTGTWLPANVTPRLSIIRIR